MNGARISVVNYSEVLDKLSDHGCSINEFAADIQEADIELTPVDVRLAEIAAMWNADMKAAGLSLGDRFGLALAKQASAVAITTDHAWTSVARTIGVTVERAR